MKYLQTQSRGSKLTKNLSQYFFRGLITALPLGLTVYLLYVFLSWSESVAMQMIRPFIGRLYVPGMGLLLGVTLILLLGFLVSQRGAAKLLETVQRVTGIKPGETDAQSRFSLETGSCLGSCSLGPEIIVNGRHHARMTPAKVEDVLKDYP